MCAASVDLSAAVRGSNWPTTKQAYPAVQHTCETDYKHTNKQGTSTCWIGFLEAACFLLLVKLPLFFFIRFSTPPMLLPVPKSRRTKSLKKCSSVIVFGNFYTSRTLVNKTRRWFMPLGALSYIHTKIPVDNNLFQFIYGVDALCVCVINCVFLMEIISSPALCPSCNILYPTPTHHYSLRVHAFNSFRFKRVILLMALKCWF